MMWLWLNTTYCTVLVEPNEVEKRIAEMLLFYLQILQFNAYEIYETRFENGHGKTTYIGVAIYCTASLFNHDCNPAAIR